MKHIISYFKKSDPRLYSLLNGLDSLERLQPVTTNEYFAKLCREIITQQLATGAARAIFNRFINLYPKQKITPEYTLKIREKNIRNAGLSWAKVKYIKDLAQKVVSKEVRLSKLLAMTNEEAIIELIKVKGIGKWTAEMFLMFSLGREDVFSYGDLGLRKAIKKLYKLKELPTKEQAEKIASKWSPYRTYACRILWSSIE